MDRTTLPCALLLAALLALFPTPKARSQTLAQAIPASTLVYFRQNADDPLAATQKMLSGGGLWSSPIDVEQFFEAMDEGLGMADDMLGLETGSLSTYVRSMKTIEGALIRADFSDGFPDMDWIVMVTTPQAEKIYKILSGKLMEEALGDPLSDDEMEVNFGEEFGLNIARKDDRLVVASSRSLLNSIVGRLGSSMAKSLARDQRFRAAIAMKETVPDYCFYLAPQTFMDMGRRAMPQGGRASMADAAMTSLGIYKICALGWNELPTHSHMAIMAEGEIPLFEMAATSKGSYTDLARMPSETALGMVWNGNATHLWKKAGSFLLDSKKFPFGPFIEEELRSFQKMMGMKIEEIAELADDGMAFGLVPDKNGRIDDDGEYFFVTLRSADPARREELAQKVMAAVTRRAGGEFTQHEEDGYSWYHFDKENRRSDIPDIVFTETDVIIAVPDLARRVIGARLGTHPTLQKMGAMKGLPQQASMFAFVGLKSIMAQEREFGAAFSRLRDGAGIAVAVDMEPDRVVLRTNRPVSEAFGVFAAAGALSEVTKKQRRATQKDLEMIAKAYRDYRGRTGKDPKLMSDLKFEDNKPAPLYPPMRPKGQAGKPYVLVSTADADLEDLNQVIVVTPPDTRFGRLAGVLSGKSRRWSEARWKRFARRQKLQ